MKKNNCKKEYKEKKIEMLYMKKRKAQ